MSDSKSSYGDPVEEPTPEEGDVVDRANAGLADAEAAGRVAVPEQPETEVVVAEPVDVEPVAVVDEPEPWYDRPLDETPGAAEPEPAITPSEPVAETVVVVEPAVAEAPLVAPAPVVSPALQPIFVQAPEPPRPRGNRGAAGAIGLLASVAFAIVFLGIALAWGALTGTVTAQNAVTQILGVLTTWAFWTPVVVFFIAFWLLGAIINRGRWGHWVVWGLLVGVAAYAGFLLGQLFQAPFWQLTAREGAQLLQDSVLAPLAIVSFVLGRELTIWFGAWAAARAKRVSELNDEAQREYERTLEAGPQLYQQ
jgi:hypothetical protein